MALLVQRFLQAVELETWWRVTQSLEKPLGPDNINTLHIINNLGEIFREENSNRAEEIFELL